RKELVRKVYFLFSLGREVHTLTLGVATAVFIRGGYDPVWLRRGRVTRLLLLVAGLFLLLQMRPLRKQYPRAISLPRRVLRSKDLFAVELHGRISGAGPDDLAADKIDDKVSCI